MAIDLRHDEEAGVVWIRASDVLTYRDFQLIKWPEMAPGTLQVLDTRDAVDFRLTTDQIKALAHNEAGEDLPVSRMAIVTGRQLAYGLARMFEMLTEDAGYEVAVFNEMDDAVAWLGIEGAV